MGEEPTLLEDTLVELRTIIRWILSGLIEALFIICWVLTQWIVNELIISRFRISGEVDKTVLTIAQWLFAIATLTPILFFLVQLIVTMSVRTYRYIRKELKK